MTRPRPATVFRWTPTWQPQRRWFSSPTTESFNVGQSKSPANGVRLVLGRQPATQNSAAAIARYPVVAELEATAESRVFNSRQRVSGRGLHKAGRTRSVWHARSEIVSPELCDDVLTYIGPELRKHQGCDILDLNPGIGLWSSKLHDFLTPRTHILLEPRPDLYKNYLDPLLQQEGASYKLIEGDPHDHATVKRVIEDRVLFRQAKLKEDDPRIAEPNNTLLVTGILSHDMPLAFGPSQNLQIDRRTLTHLVASAWDLEQIHTYGRVRMLLWINNADLSSFLKKVVTDNGNGFSYMAAKLFDVREVVTPKPASRGHGKRVRDSRHILQSASMAVASARKLGFDMPPNRQSSLYKIATSIVDRGVKGGDTGVDGAVDILENAELNGVPTTGLLRQIHRNKLAGEMMLAQDPSITIWQPERPGKVRTGKGNLTEWGREHQLNVAATKLYQRNRRLSFERVDLSTRIYETECEHLNSSSSEKLVETQSRLDRLNSEMDESMSRLIPINRPVARIDIDNHYAINSPVPTMPFDQRPYEAMEMREEETWPAARLSLMDFQPRVLPPSATPRGKYDFYWDFIRILHERAGHDVASALESVQPGASEILHTTPELRDIAKGGRLPHSVHFRVRVLTLEMIDALYKSYMEWPFRDESGRVGKLKKWE